MCNTPIPNKSNAEINQISYAKAIISCFALFFPDHLKEEVLACSSYIFSKGENDELRTEFVKAFDPQKPQNSIISLSSTFHYMEKESFDDLRLVAIFDILFSNRIKIVERAALISTFRALRKCYYKNFCKDHDTLDSFITNSYNLYCESVTNSIKIDFFSDNLCGALTQTFDFFDNEDQRHECSLDKNTTNLYYCEKVNFDWKAKHELKNKEQKIEFLSEIYYGLKKLTQKKDTDNWAILTFPKENEKLEYFQSENGKSFPIQCTKENFIAMFDGVVEEEPTRTMISAPGDCLSKFVDAMDCTYGNRNIFAEGLRRIIVQSNGKEFTINTLQQNSRNHEIKKKYREIIKDAYENAKKLTYNKK